jgi:hypothetical protein
MKPDDYFFTTKDTKGHEKISWEAQRIRAEEATSMKFFRVHSGISLFKKNFSVTRGHYALRIFSRPKHV